MEDIVLAEEVLEQIENILYQLEDVISGNFSTTEELLHQIKDDLEIIIRD